MQPLHVTMQPLNNAEILIPCTRWITIQHLNNASNLYSLHKVGYYAASE